MEINKVDISEKLKLFNDYWSPKIVGELNGQYVKLAKIKGEFIRHKHDNEDEMFYVLKAKLNMEFRDKIIEINKGEFIIVPKGVEHKPFANEEVELMLIEPTTTLNTGNINNELTKENLKKI